MKIISLLLYCYTRLPARQVAILLILFFFTPITYAQNKVLINEFLIEPTQTVEIINISNENTDISNWYIDDSGGSTYFTIPNNTVIYGNSCLVFSSNFYLNVSSSDTVRLFDSTASPTSQSAKLIDYFSYLKSPGSGISFFRLPDAENNWISGYSSLGKFNSSGNSCIVLPTPTKTPTPTVIPTTTPTLTLTPILTSTPTPSISLTPTTKPSLTPILTPITTSTPTPISTPTEKPISYDNIFLSEIMPYPETGSNEWLEIYNNNNFDINLTNWYIDDIENTGSSPKVFSLNLYAKNYVTLDLTTSMFNNDGDSVRLLDFNKNLKDSFEYKDAVKGKTFGRVSFDSDEFCLQEPSKNQPNNSCLNPTISPASTSTKTPTPSKTPTPTASFITTSLINRSSQRQAAGSVIQQPKLQSPNLENSYFQGDILGLSTSANIKNSLNSVETLVNALCFVSFSYSLLTILSLLLKIKYKVQN